MTKKERGPVGAIIENEKSRIAIRDNNLLLSEIERLRGRDKSNMPPVQTLEEYCEWLSPRRPRVVKWDLLRHHATTKKAPYLKAFRKNNGVICKPHHEDYKDRLLTHSLNIRYWSQAKEQGYLPGHPMVCFSSGQVVFKGVAIDAAFSMTIIFDRKTLDEVYALSPYSDHEVEWEREIRAHEPISLDLALGTIPTSKFLLDHNYWGQLTSVCGKRIIGEMERYYIETGVIQKLH